MMCNANTSATHYRLAVGAGGDAGVYDALLRGDAVIELLWGCAALVLGGILLGAWIERGER
jgi:hypothetical protein